MKKIVPFHEVPQELLLAKAEQLSKNGHRPFYTPDGSVAGFVSPFSASRHVAQVEVDAEGKIIGFDFDQIERTDGAMDVNDPWGHATPNAMVVVIEDRDGELWVHSVNEPRPFMYDHRSGEKGMQVVGVTGKWAKEVGKNPAATALEGLIADAGIEVEESSVELVGIHNPNRAWVETCNEVFVAKFKRAGEPIGDGTHDAVLAGDVYPLGDFPVGPDALVNSALWLTAKHFGCISSKPLK
ncbi:MAG: hypothetical protein QY322_01895 [bacterium]|nr:MAG: hypothetical protein QY322_01895 [bacterium]